MEIKIAFFFLSFGSWFDSLSDDPTHTFQTASALMWSRLPHSVSMYSVENTLTKQRQLRLFDSLKFLFVHPNQRAKF